MDKKLDGGLSALTDVMGWIRIEEKRPHPGERCLICVNGVVQHEAYQYAESDDCPSYWSRADIEECPFVKEGQLWMPLPRAPTA